MSPPRSRWRRLARWALVTLLLLAVAAFLGRDLPRRLVERELAKTLGGEARLASLGWPRKDGITLYGFELLEPTFSPALRRLEIAEIEVSASWRQLLGGAVDHLELRGLAAEVDPARPLLAAGDAPEAPFRSLEVADGARISLIAADGHELAAAEVAASLANGPGFPGRFRAKVSGLDLGDLEAVMPLELPEALRRQLELLDLGPLELEGSSGEGGLQLTARGRAWRAAAFSLRGGELDGRIEALDLAALSPPGAPAAATGRLDLALRGSLAAAVLELELSPASFRLGENELKLDGARLDGRLEKLADGYQLELRLSPASFATGGQKIATGGLHLKGRLDPLPAGYQLDVAELEVVLLAASALPPDADPLLPLTLAWQGQIELVGRAAAGRGSLTSAALGVFPFDGRVSAAQGLDLAVATPLLEVARLLALAPTAGARNPDARGTLSAKARLSGQLAAPAARIELDFAGLESADFAELAAANLHQVHGSARLRWSAARPLAASFEDLVARATARLAAGSADLPLEARAAGAFDLERRTLELRQLTLETGQLGRLSGELALELPADFSLAGARARAALELGGIDLKTWLDFLKPPGMPPGMSFSGALAAAPRLAKEPGQPWLALGTWSLAGAGFASASGDRVLEGLAVGGEFNGELAAEPAQGAAWRLEAKGKSSGFLLLWGALFGDFSPASVGLAARAAGRLGGDPSFEVELEPSEGVRVLAELEARAEARPDGPRRYRLELAAADLAAVRRDWLLPLYAETAPRVLTGSLALAASGELPAAPGGDFSANGRLQVKVGQLRKAELEADEMALDLPFDLRAAGGRYSGSRQNGRLAARRLAVRGLEMPPLESRLWSEADAVGLEQALEVAFSGGTVRLERVVAGELLAEHPRLETAIGFSGISLAELSAGAGFLPLEGRLDGSLPRVVVQGEKLEVEGGGKIALFGGEVEVGDISGRDVFSPYPRLRLSARFRELDLGQITRRFDFGEMQGIIEGEIENCEIFRNVPLSFKARVISVERRGVKQSIDVKAVQNLTILGTGASTNIFDRGIQRFFKRYNYAKLGITAQLGNDVLLLRGLEHRGEQELFLRGRRPFSIDIVNAQPGKTVSFLAMVRRLRSLNLSQARKTP